MSLFRDAFAIQRGFYEGGKLRGANNDFSNAGGSFEDTASPDRAVMTQRARWLHENNGIISGIDHSIKVNTLGAHGLRFQSKTGIDYIDKAIEVHYQEWCEPKNCDITRRQHNGDQQKLILGQRMCDGEILIQKKLTNDKRHPLKLQMFETDRFDTMPFNSAAEVVDGIEVDAYGAPQKYRLRDGLFSTKKVDASDVIHYYKMANRYTQYRGISEYKQVIIDLRNLAGFNSSFIQAIRSRSGVAMVIETDNVSGRVGALSKSETTYDPIYDINGVMVHYLNKGEKLSSLDQSINGTEYGEFMRTAIRMIAVGRKVSYELAFRDYSQVNFSSGRLGRMEDHRLFSEEQWHMATYVLNPLYEAWLDANVMAGNIKGLSPDAYFADKKKFVQPRWIAPAREWIDPLKDIKAFIEEYNLGGANLGDYVASKGKDLEEVLEQRKKENEMLKAAGILTEEEANA
ncbi:phage portal protein [Sulfurimonas sp. ST-25]|uniref:phage portal protein n=1 Tax=Sulfurimonas sp. ST-25 TaxID=3400151 RepID=UPI003A83C6CE